MPHVPRKPHRRNSLAAFLAWAHDRLTGTEPLLVAGPGISVGLNQYGQYLLQATGLAGGSACDLKNLTLARITEVDLDDNRLVCQPLVYNVTAAELQDSAGAEIYVCIPYYLQNSQVPTTDTGLTYIRDPEYEVDGIVIAGYCQHGTHIGPSTWVDLTPRSWALNLPICIDDVQYTGVIHCGDVTEV